MKNLKVGKYIIPIWLIAILSVSGIGAGVLAYHLWNTLVIPLMVKEPIEIQSYPSELSLFPGETEEFNITVKNHASVIYSVILDFTLDNTTYQDNYVTFSNETYTVIPGQQNLAAWLIVESHAPPINASLTIDFRRLAEAVIFYDDFGDNIADGWTKHLGTWSVVDGEYRASVPGVIETGISTVDALNLTDYVIQTKVRFTDAVGFRAEIIFRFTNNEYYTFGLSNEYDVAFLAFYQDLADVGEILADTGGDGSYPIQTHTEYLLRVEIQGNTFKCFIDDVELFSRTDETFSSGRVGLRARRADVFFDNFKVVEIL